MRRDVDHYSLEAILAVGYRVRSPRGTEFRQWATARLAEYLVKGFVLDDERLKGNASPADHFDELLERIRDIRASEARVYQRIREIFAMAVDYREGEQATHPVLRHHAEQDAPRSHRPDRGGNHPPAGGRRPAEHGVEHLEGQPGTQAGHRHRQELPGCAGDRHPHRITVMFLDQAEFRAMRRQDIRLADWDGFLDKFLRDTELPVLDSAGTVSQVEAKDWAVQQYDTFAERRRLEAEQVAEARYLEDLRKAADAMKSDAPAGMGTPQKKAAPDKGDKA